MWKIRLNESTAARRRVPVVLVDSTDRVTPETGVTLSAGDLKISKAGGAEANHAGTFTELSGGDYYYELDAGEVDTLGYVTGRISKTGIAAFRFALQVVEDIAATVDAIKAVTDNLPDDGALTSLGAEVADVATEILNTPTEDFEGTAPPNSLGGAVIRASHAVAPKSGDPNTLEVKNAAGSAVLYEVPITTDPDLEPIESIGPAATP